MVRQVRRPTMPSTVSPACRWKRRTAWIVVSSMVSQASAGRPSRRWTILTFTPFMPGVKIVQPRAGTMVVVGRSQSAPGSAGLSVGVAVGVWAGFVDLGAVGFGVVGVVGVAAEAVLGSGDGAVAMSRSDPQPEPMTTRIAMATPLGERILCSLPIALC